MVDFNLDGGLIVGGCGESLGFFGRDSGVLVDEMSEDIIKSFDIEGKGGNIKKENVGNIIGKNICLDRGVDGDGFIRVDIFVRFFIESRFDSFNDFGYLIYIINENDVVDFRSFDISVVKSFFIGFNSLVNKRFDNGFEMSMGKVKVDVLRIFCGSSNVRKRDVGGVGRR